MHVTTFYLCFGRNLGNDDPLNFMGTTDFTLLFTLHLVLMYWIFFFSFLELKLERPFFGVSLTFFFFLRCCCCSRRKGYKFR